MVINLKESFSRKLLVQIYFVFFIFLNVIDFLNIIGGDLDFFKKLLSWTLIGYIFYKVSFTKIFVGQRMKGYDLGFILGFCFMTIPKALLLYVQINDITKQSFSVFYYILKFIPSSSETFLIFSFLTGLLIVIILSVVLLLNSRVSTESFVGSFNIKEGYFKYALEQIILTLVLIFFGIVIFNFFMEWFALAVDSVILVIGLIYYIFVYIHSHTSGRFSDYLKAVSNSGNDFYNNLISNFSDKKSLFVGISFLLTLHLLVDVGVYLIPYSIGTQNTLYFNSLNAVDLNGNLRSHNFLFSLWDFKDSLIYGDLTDSSVYGDWLLSFGVVLIYLGNIFLFLSLMVLPFLIYYKMTKGGSIVFKRFFIVLFLSLIVLYFVLGSSYFNGVSNPINIGKSYAFNVKGVDIYTSYISGISIDSLELLLSEIIFLVCFFLFFLLYRFLGSFFIKLVYVFVLLFFVCYIGIFFMSTVEYEFNSLKGDLLGGQDVLNSSLPSNFYERFDSVNSVYLDSQVFKKTSRGRVEMPNISIAFVLFANSSYVDKVSPHKDYILFNIEKSNDLKYPFVFDESSQIFLSSNNLDYKDDGRYKFVFLGKENLSLIYFLGENVFDFNKSENEIMNSLVARGNESFVSFNYKDKRVLTYDMSLIANNLFEKKELKQGFFSKLERFSEYLRLVCLSVFYVLGTISFVWVYVKNNIFGYKDT